MSLFFPLRGIKGSSSKISNFYLQKISSLSLTLWALLYNYCLYCAKVFLNNCTVDCVSCIEWNHSQKVFQSIKTLTKPCVPLSRTPRVWWCDMQVSLCFLLGFITAGFCHSVIRVSLLQEDGQVAGCSGSLY